MSRGGQEILKTNIEYRTRNIELRSEKPSKFFAPCSIFSRLSVWRVLRFGLKYSSRELTTRIQPDGSSSHPC
jgi:hypothetical protein